MNKTELKVRDLRLRFKHLEAHEIHWEAQLIVGT
jgi:hypothetical protein